MFLSGLCRTLVVNSYEERFQKKKKMHTLIIKLLLIIVSFGPNNAYRCFRAKRRKIHTRFCSVRFDDRIHVRKAVGDERVSTLWRRGGRRDGGGKGGKRKNNRYGVTGANNVFLGAYDKCVTITCVWLPIEIPTGRVRRRPSVHRCGRLRRFGRARDDLTTRRWASVGGVYIQTREGRFSMCLFLSSSYVFSRKQMH